MAMWCEILYFQYHPCGLRRLSLPTQGHCFSERKAEYVGALCSQRWKKVTTSQKWAYLEACTVFVCVWIPHLLIMRKTCESQTARNWFLLSSTFNLSNLFQRYIQTLISYLFARIFFPPKPDAVNVLLHEQRSFCLWENRRGLYPSVLWLVVLEALFVLGNFCLLSRVTFEDMQTVPFLQHWS